MASISKLEKQYIQSSLLAKPPFRSDGRDLLDYRPLFLETSVVPLANGSARTAIGEGSSRTEVLAAVKLEVEDVDERTPTILCTVTCSPSAYPSFSPAALDDLSADLTNMLHTTLSHVSLAVNLDIVTARKRWACHLDAVILSDSGNVVDALWAAVRAALCDTRVPSTMPVAYRAETNAMDVDDGQPRSGFDTRATINAAADFELTSYWDEGEVLGGWDAWPVGITLNIVPPIYYLDASTAEEAATSLKLILIFSLRNEGRDANLQGMHLVGTDGLSLATLTQLIKEGEKHARDLFGALNAKLREEVRRGKKARDDFRDRIT